MQFDQKLISRRKLTGVLAADIKGCEELKGEKFIQQLAVTQEGYDNVIKEVEAEDAIIDQIQVASDAFEAVVEQMKIELDEIIHSNPALHEKFIPDYHDACRWRDKLKSRFEESFVHKSINDENGKKCADLLDNLEERSAQEKLAAEKKDSPLVLSQTDLS